LVEAHNAEGEMFGFPRLRSLLTEHDDEGLLVDVLMEKHHSFTGEDWEQEEGDITLVTLRRTTH
jgi:serine phosphatase RsbU (regulator of sigma subunit)